MKEPKSDGRPVCVITGGTSGIGLATAKLFSRHGYRVAICGRREALLKQAEAQLKTAAGPDAESFTRQVDLNDPIRAREFGNAVIAAWGRIDVLVNNAGFAPLAAFDEIDPAIFETTLNVNLRSVFHLTQVVWKQMLGQGSGVIVNISSQAAVDPFPGFSVYGASKAWLDLMTIALAAEGSSSGIRVFSIRPGAVETPMLRNLFPDFPAQQCVSPGEVAEKIWGCVSEPENYESGTAYDVTNQT
jgi:NAD(P)-dependent dehydrogenase (short-subunit alcohol dehydrogenase family)